MPERISTLEGFLSIAMLLEPRGTEIFVLVWNNVITW